MSTTRRGLFRAIAGVLVSTPLVYGVHTPAPHQGIDHAAEHGDNTVTLRLYLDGKTVAEQTLSYLRDAVRQHGIRPV